MLQGQPVAPCLGGLIPRTVSLLPAPGLASQPLLPGFCWAAGFGSEIITLTIMP